MSHAKEIERRNIAYHRPAGYTDAQLLALYRSILLPRMIEEKMLVLLRQGKISKWFSGIGQEAVAAGIGLNLKQEDYTYPLHRNLGLFLARGIPMRRLFEQWQGKPGGFTRGRDRSFHFGTTEYRTIGMISHLGAMLNVGNGTALAARLKDEPFISVAFSGDGGASEGDFHEALNVAAVWQLPIIFVIENNGYGLSTPSSEQFRCRQFIDKAIGYGMEGIKVEGNNILEVHSTFAELAEELRRHPRPFIFEAMTFRMRGHEEASGTKYVPAELMQQWAARDPVLNFEWWLQEEQVLSAERVQEIRNEFKAEINREWKAADNAPDVEVSRERELGDVYAPAYHPTPPEKLNSERQLRFVDALSEGLRQAMEHNDRLILMGQDIAEYGGVFKITDGFLAQFGKQRVRNTPLCESGILGAALGLSLEGYPSMVEMQFADFVSCGFNQIVNNLAKTHYRWQHPVNVTIRMPTGAGVAAGPFHSQSNEAWFFHTPGLKVVYPAFPQDAKGLLTTSLKEPNPVLFFEHKYLYRRVTGPVPEAYYELPLGKAAVVAPGTDLSVVTYGSGVHWALEARERFPEVEAEIIDLRTLLPWDREAVFASVRKTSKVLFLQEDTRTGGIGAEIVAEIAEQCFEVLDGPVKRVGALDTPVPFNPALEEQFLPKERFFRALQELAAY